MPSVDGFVIPIAKRNIPAYRRLARDAGKVGREYGALEFHECVADDLAPDMGGVKVPPPFPRMTKLKRRETVLFSWIVYRSRAHRDRVNAKVLKDPRIADQDPTSMPFDVKRMAYAGFRSLVDL